LRRKLPGSEVKVMKPSSTPTSSGPKVRKKSARAYGSTMAWSDASASCSSSAGVANGESFLPAAPRKSPITAMSGLKTFEDPGGGPAGSGSEAGSGTGTGSGDALGEGDGMGDGSWAAAVRTNDNGIKTDESRMRARDGDRRRIKDLAE
jgi:hypothetical protein